MIAIVTGALYAWQVHDESARAACQASYNEAFAQQLAIRSKVSTASDVAQSDFLSGVSRLFQLPPSKDPKVQATRSKEFRELLVGFDRAVAKADAARAANPLPPLPDC